MTNPNTIPDELLLNVLGVRYEDGRKQDVSKLWGLQK